MSQPISPSEIIDTTLSRIAELESKTERLETENERLRAELRQLSGEKAS